MHFAWCFSGSAGRAGKSFASDTSALLRDAWHSLCGWRVDETQMVRIARRAPGSADMRAALAALYWAGGRSADAEREWEWACNEISVGCAKFQDEDWLSRIRRCACVPVS
jgi:hypothetical protein